ncbi:MAG: EAL domain-containing protein [Burkholderiales bacterium]|nr:EAL domain-containing protein [Burkholderiales bacterium]
MENPHIMQSAVAPPPLPATLVFAPIVRRVPDKPLVLVVDDDMIMREMLQIALEDEGFRVTTTGDGAEGLRCFGQVQPDIVVTDANMPVMDGFALCEALRARSASQYVPILMLTAAQDTDSITAAFTCGATDFATKPLQENLIGHRLRYLLQGSRNLSELARSESRLANAQRIGRIGNWDLNISEDAVSSSAEACRILGAQPVHSPRTWIEYLRFIYQDDRAQVARWMAEMIRTGQPTSLEHRVVRQDGSLRYVFVQAEIATDDDGKATHVSGTIQDISDRKEASERIAYLAMYDALTGLPNRRLCTERLDTILARASRRGGTVAVMIVGLDGFKRVNEARGHSTGDALLVEVSGRLKDNLRQGDEIAYTSSGKSSLDAVARLGGDTFAITLTDLGPGENAAAAATRVQALLSGPCVIDGESLHVTASVGIAVFPVDGSSGPELLTNAESAMHAAKLERRNGIRFFTAEMNAGAARKLAMANELRSAIDTEQLSLHYQPQVDLASGRIVGAEALIRWTHPVRGPISPADFIPLAEELGLILRLGEWALRTACTTARSWQRAGMPPVRVGVNVSPSQFREPDFPRMIERVLVETGLDARCLDLEFTEGVMIGDPEAAIETMRVLRRMGVQLAIDDFGTGYSSLSYLRLFPVQRLKIDQSFVRTLDADEQSTAIVETVVMLGRALKLNVIAEGVETHAHATRLRALGCDEVQGYLVSRALPEGEFRAKLESDWRLAH